VKAAAIAAREATKAFIRNGLKIAAKTAATAPAKAAMGPLGWAMLAFDIVSAALDIYDPVGYSEFMSNEVAMNLRNIAEQNFQVIFENEGATLPVMADFDYQNPTGQFATKHVIPKVYVRLSEQVINNIPIEMLESFEEQDLVAQQAYIGDETYKLLEAYVETDEYKKEVCETYRNQSGNRSKVRWINNAGCSMTESECKKFNKYQSKLDPNDRQFALYTSRYRKKVGGSVKKPKMRTFNLPQKACMLSPLQWAKEACTSDKGTWNEHEAMCSFSSRYCTRMGLKTHRMRSGINNCVMFPGQKIAEMFFGQTITRHVIRTFDPRSYKALFSGDLSLLKAYGHTMAYLSLGPFGMALAIGFKLGGVNVNLHEYTPIGAIMKHHRAIGRGFENAAEAVADSAKEFTNLLELGVTEILDSMEKLAKISAKFGKDAAREVASWGKEGIDQVDALFDKIPFNELGDAIGKGFNEVKKVWGSIFGWIRI
jgi:hypothetical protein